MEEAVELPLIRSSFCSTQRGSGTFLQRNSSTKDILRKHKNKLSGLITPEPDFINIQDQEPQLLNDDIAKISTDDRKAISLHVKELLRHRNPRNASDIMTKTDSVVQVTKPRLVKKPVRRDSNITNKGRSSVPRVYSLDPLGRCAKKSKMARFADVLTNSCEKYVEEMTRDDSADNAYPQKLASLDDASTILADDMLEYCMYNKKPNPVVSLKEVKYRREPKELDLGIKQIRENFLKKAIECSKFVYRLRHRRVGC